MRRRRGQNERMRQRGFVCGSAVLWVALGLSPSLGHAEGTFAEAKAAVANGDIEAAVTILDAIIAANPQQGDALLLRGSIRLDSRDWSGALEAYEQYLAVAPRGAQKRAVEKMVASLAPVRTSKFELTVPDGATAYLDSKSLGVFCQAAPTCSKNVLPGEHRLILEQEGFDKLVVAVAFETGKTVRLNKALRSKPSKLTLNIQPASADVLIDGAPAAALPQNELLAGEHLLTVTLAGHVTYRQTIVAAAGKPVDVSVLLQKLVTVKDVPANATITVDGKASEIVDGQVAIPADGNAHAVIVSAPEMLDKKTEARAVDSQIDARLRKAAIALSLATGSGKAKVFIDGTAQGPAPWRIPAGEHTIEVRSSTGTETRKATFEDDTQLRITGTEKRSRTKLWITLGATDGLATLGGVTGYWAVQNADRYTAYQKEAGAARIDPTSQDYRQNSQTGALISDVALVGAGLGAVLVGYWWLTEPKHGGALRVEIGPTGGAVGGRF